MQRRTQEWRSRTERLLRGGSARRGFVEGQFADAGRDVQARGAFDAQGLQGHRPVGAADKHVRARAHTGRCAGGQAAVMAVEVAAAQRRCRGNTPHTRTPAPW